MDSAVSSYVPVYWVKYQTALLPRAIARLKRGGELGAADVALLKDYFAQWAAAGVWDDNPCNPERSCERLRKLRRSVELIEDEEDVRNWVAIASALGMDPL